MKELTKEILDQLAAPFPPDVIDWKPGATNRDKTKALALAYVEVRYYIDRLNEVIGPDWSDEYQFISPSGELISCGLTICGVTRWDIGEKDSKDVNTATSALAQSFKRACVKFGLGRHLYAMDRVWVPYDAEYKRFTNEAFVRLRQLASGEAPRPATSEPAVPAKARQQKSSAKSKTSENNGNVPTNPQKLLAYVDSKIDGEYGNLPDLLLGIQAELGEGWNWPTARDTDGWAEARDAAIKHAA